MSMKRSSKSLTACLVLALIAALGELIPIVGPVLSAIPAIAVAFTVSPTLAFGVTVFFFIQQQFENHVLVPKVMERQVGVSAAAVIVALLIGGTLLGIVGAVLVFAAICLTTPWLAPRSALGRFCGEPAVRTAVALYIAVTGGVYVLVLRHLWAPQGLQWLADTLLHYVTPVLFVIDWLALSPARTLPWRAERARWQRVETIHFPLSSVLTEREWHHPRFRCFWRDRIRFCTAHAWIIRSRKSIWMSRC